MLPAGLWGGVTVTGVEQQSCHLLSSALAWVTSTLSVGPGRGVPRSHGAMTAGRGTVGTKETGELSQAREKT